MFTPSPSPIRAIAYIAATVALALFLSSCAESRAKPLHVGPGLTVIYEHRDDIYASYTHSTRTIRLSSLSPRYALAHELCHVADHLGGFDKAMAALGACDLYGMDIVRQVAAQSAADSRPRPHWVALGRISGPQAVGHSEILASIRRFF